MKEDIVYFKYSEKKHQKPENDTNNPTIKLKVKINNLQK